MSPMFPPVVGVLVVNLICDEVAEGTTLLVPIVTTDPAEPLPAVTALAVEAVPDNEAVIVPAAKLPEPSRITIVETVFPVA